MDHNSASPERLADVALDDLRGPLCLMPITRPPQAHLDEQKEIF